MNDACKKCKRRRSCNTLDKSRGMPCKDFMRTTKDTNTKTFEGYLNGQEFLH